MRELLRNFSFLRHLRFLYYILMYRIWSLVLRVEKNRVLFLSDSHIGFIGNFKFLREEVLKQDPEATIEGIFKPSLSTYRRLSDIWRIPRSLARASTVVLDDFYPLIYPIRLRPDTKLLQVWHAAGAFKQVGHSRAGLPGGPPKGAETHRNYTHATVSSEAIRPDYAEAFGITIEKVLALGVPRSDVFADATEMARLRASARTHLGVSNDDRLVVFAPTFRGNGQLTAYTDETADWGAIAKQLGDGWKVGVRRHPFTAANALPDSVLDAATGLDMTSVLAAADVLVTDYSSAIFEYALLRRPVVFFVPDLADYNDARSFYRPFERYLIGPAVERPEELAEAIRSAKVEDSTYDAFLDEFCSALDGNSTERIVREIILAPTSSLPSVA